MSVKVNYKGSEILSLSTDSTKKLTTSGEYCEDDFTIVNTQDGAGGSTSAVGEMIIVSDIQEISISFAINSSPALYGFSTDTPKGSESAGHIVSSWIFPDQIYSQYIASNYQIGHETVTYIKNVSKDGMTLDAKLCGSTYFFGAGHTLKWWAMCE